VASYLENGIFHPINDSQHYAARSMCGQWSQITGMQRRNCLSALHFSGKCSEHMPKQQRNSAWQLAAHGTWKARFSALRQSLWRSFALIHTALLSGSMQWKVATCNGNLYCATETHTSCNGKPQRATESHTSCNGKLVFTQQQALELHQRDSLCYLMIPYRIFISSMRSTD